LPIAPARDDLDTHIRPASSFDPAPALHPEVLRRAGSADFIGLLLPPSQPQLRIENVDAAFINEAVEDVGAVQLVCVAMGSRITHPRSVRTDVEE
jgi:hypothetical protein